MIPPFDHNNVLPPYVEGGNPAKPSDQSPYKSDILEFCQRFATSSARIIILKGFVQFRLDMIANGVRGSHQWIDGSFIENVEVSQSRDPRDIDVASFVIIPNKAEETRLLTCFPAFANTTMAKATYYVDHYVNLLNGNPLYLIESSKYWSQLFSHNRSGVWKGMVQLPLYADDALDKQAMDYLNTLRV